MSAMTLTHRDVEDVLPPTSQAAAGDAVDAPTRRSKPVTAGEWVGIIALALATCGLYVDGVILSFGAVQQEMAPWFSQAWLVPVGVDGGIGVTLGMDLYLAYRDRSVPWLK